MADLRTNLELIKQEKEQKIIPENIKKGVDIFGVTGTLEAGGGTPVEGVKQFATVEEMNASTGNKEGDLAIVYGSSVANLTADTEFTKATLPDTVVLPEAFTGNARIQFQAADPSQRLDCWGDMSNTYMRCDFMTGNPETDYRINYISADGITYTKQEGTPTEITFEHPIKFGSPNFLGAWDDAIGYFFQVIEYNFGGLYEFNLNVVTDSFRVREKNSNKFDFTKPNNNTDITVSGIYKGETVFTGETIGSNIAAIMDESQNLRQYALNKDMTKLYEFTNGSNDIWVVNDIFYIAPWTKAAANICNVYDLTDNNKLISTTEYPYETVTEPTGSSYQYITYPADIFWILGTNATYTGGTILHYYIGTTDNKVKWSVPIAPEAEIKDKYLPAPTQLTAEANDVYNSVFLGKNGTSTGTLTKNISSIFTDTNAKVYSDIIQVYNTMTPRVLTDDDKTIDMRTQIIPSKMDGTPLLDTSNVTNMAYLFRSCKNLTTIPLLDTSKATNMAQIFNDCTNLKGIPLLDTSKVTDMRYAFKDCKNLTTIPQLNTIKVTNMEGIFSGCTNLKVIPQLETSNVTDMSYAFKDCKNLKETPLLNTAKITNMYYMFNGCSNLVTIPVLDTSNATSMTYMFDGCLKLSDESLNNILQMCIIAKSFVVDEYNHKTLARIGISQEQANRCQGLSNWQAFLDAGWTSGY